MDSLNEQFIQTKIGSEVKRFETQYEEYISEAADIFNKRYSTIRQWNDFDSHALGSYLENYEQYLPLFEADATTRDNLGDVLKSGLGLVAASYATLPISFMATVQPIQDEVGVIYYRKLLATATRGGVSAGAQIGGPTGDFAPGIADYYSEHISANLGVVNTADLDNVYALSAPVRPRTIKITITNATGTTVKLTGIDDGEGFIIGNGFLANSTINYTTGSLRLENAATGLTNGDLINIEYDQNLIETDSVPGFQWVLTSKTVRANYFVLQSVFSSVAEFTVRKRFGTNLSDDIAADAVTQINAAVITSAIGRLKILAAANSGITWDATKPDGISDYEHRKTFYDALDAAQSGMANDTGRGAVTFIIAGSKGRRVLNAIGMSKIGASATPGPHLHGYLDGIPVYTAPSNIIGDGDVYCGYRGTSWFEAPLVYSPFLPIVSAQGRSGSNVFKKVQGVAHAAGIEGLVSQFVRKITISNMA